MRAPIKSIYSQVLVSFMLVILLTLTVSTIMEYFLYTSELPGLFTEIRGKTLARQISSFYTRNNGWSDLDFEIQRLDNLESLNTGEDAVLRIIVRDMEGRTVYNSFSNLLRIEDQVLMEGESQPLVNYNNTQQVGVLTIYISQAYILEHVRDYTSRLLNSAFIKGLFTALIAAAMGLVLSGRITRPVIKLTAAAEAVAEDGETRLIEITSSDEIGQLGRSFNSMVASLQKQRELRKNFLADVSHEINTPLNSIRLEARGLSDGLVSAEEASRRIMDEVDTLRNIIYDLDWIAESDSGEYSLDMREQDIQKLMDEEVRRWENKAKAKNIKILVNRHDKLPFVKIDTVRIGTVAGNLVENAIKYSSPGVPVTIGYRLDKEFITVSVCDDGPPIGPEHRQHVFERNYRIPGARNNIVRGRGLGLSIVKEIVELHGGRTWLECGEQKGNCFCFSLPCCKP